MLLSWLSKGIACAILLVTVAEIAPLREKMGHLIICNKCISETYPDCVANCGVEKQWRNQKVNIVKS